MAARVDRRAATVRIIVGQTRRSSTCRASQWACCWLLACALSWSAVGHASARRAALEGTYTSSKLQATSTSSGQAGGSAPQSRYFLLPNNSYGAKCLDGSPPGYQYREGYGEASGWWHIHLPGGGWCASLDKCLARSKSKLGSTRGLQNGMPTGSRSSRKASNDNGDPDAPPRGITSADAATNPTFYNWHLVRPVYCDGGGFAGRAGYRAAGNGSEGVHMDGWRIIHAILGDLRKNRGMTAPARILLSGSSAGGQAVVTLCDLLPLLFPRALVKCIMDAGLFVDAEDRTKRRAFAGMVKATVALHNMRVNWRCSQTMSAANQWRCFFPHQALRVVSSPVLAVNSLFDYRALMLGNQLPANQARATACLRQIAREGGTDLLKLVYSQSWRRDRSALAEIQAGGMLFPGGDYKEASLDNGLTSTVEEGNSTGNGKGGKRKGKGGGGGAGKGRRVSGSAGAAAAEACAPEEHTAVLNVAWQMVQYTDAASLELGPTVSTFVTPAIAHCALTSPKWDSLMDKGVTLKDAVTTWYKRPL
ncbi:unnamed protein product [Closterium sp. NIES-53]